MMFDLNCGNGIVFRRSIELLARPRVLERRAYVLPYWNSIRTRAWLSWGAVGHNRPCYYGWKRRPPAMHG